MRQLEKDMAQSAKKIDSLKSKINALNSVKTPTQEYKDVSKQIADAEKKQAALNDRMEKFVELGGKANSKQYKSMQYDAAELENTIAYAKGELQDLVDTGKAFTLGASTAEFNDLSQQLAEEQSHLNELSDQYSHSQSRIQNMSVWEGLITTFGKIRSAAKSVFLAPISGLKKATGAAKTLVKGLGSVANGFKRVAFFGAKTVGTLSGLSGISKLLGGTIGHLGKRILSLAKTAFIFGILRRAFTSLRTGVQESFGTYLNYDSELKTSINGLKAQLNALKGSLASAFAPIISAVVPYLSTLISWVTAAANAVAAFIATLSGKSSYKKAVANVDAVGAAADSAAGSLGDATEAAEELEKALGNYDDLKVIDQPDSSSSGSGSGGSGGGGSSASDITYEDVEITSAISDFAEKVKEAWKTADFTEVGTIIGEKLKDSLDNIPWDNIEEKASKVGSSLATFINGAIEVEGLGNSIGVTIGEAINTGIAGLKSLSGKLHWSSIGTFVSEGISGTLTTIEWNDLETVANNLGGGLAAALNKIMTPETFGDVGTALGKSLNTVISGAYSFISTADWKGYGNAIATGINNFFNTFDWKKAGLTFSNAVTGIMGVLSNAIKGTEWDEIGNDVWNAISAVKWGDIASSFFEVVGAAFGGLAAFIGGFISDAFSNIGQYFDEKVKESGGDIVAGIFEGIKESIVNIGSWIVNNIFTPFINGFKEAFGIHSPSTVMAEQGGYIIDGLLNGLLSAIAGIGNWIKNNILQPIKDGFGEVIEIGVAVVKDVKNWSSEAWEAVKNAGQTVVNTVKTALEKASTWSSDAWSALKNAGETVTSTVKAAVQKASTWVADAWSAVQTKADTITRTLKQSVSKGTSWITDAWTAAQTSGDVVTRLLKQSVSKGVSWVDDAWSAVKTAGTTIVRTLYQNVTKGSSWISDAWTAVKTAGSNVIRTLTQNVSKGSWATEAWSAAGKAAQTVKRTLQQSITKGSWAKDAFTVLKTGAGTVKRKVQISISWIGSKLQQAWKVITGKAAGGIYSGSTWKTLPQKANGGIFSGGSWRNIPAYAAGGNPHGTMFVAGEAGPEIVGHIGGRTEVLNKSQIASAIYSAVSEAMREAINNLGYAILQNMAECTNMVIANMTNIVDAIYRSGNLMSGRNVQLAGMPVDYTIPDTNRVSTINGSNAGAMTIDYDRLAGAVAKRISGNIEIQNNMTLDGRVIYDKMVSLNRAYIKQTGHSAFER